MTPADDERTGAVRASDAQLDADTSADLNPVNETTDPATSDEKRSPEEIRADIAQTREQLGDTAEALAAKADVKSRAQEKVEETKQNLVGKKDELVGKVKDKTSSSSSGPSDPNAPSPAEQIQAKAQENPAATAAAGGFFAGLLVGLILGRR